MIETLILSLVVNVWLWVELRKANKKTYDYWVKYTELKVENMTQGRSKKK